MYHAQAHRSLRGVYTPPTHIPFLPSRLSYVFYSTNRFFLAILSLFQRDLDAQYMPPYSKQSLNPSTPLPHPLALQNQAKKQRQASLPASTVPGCKVTNTSAFSVCPQTSLNSKID